LTRLLVVGLGVTGEAVTRFARARGDDVVVVEDAPAGERYAMRAAEARASGAEISEHPDEHGLAALVGAADVVVPSPGVAERHPVYRLARAAGVPVRSEIELAGALIVAGGATLVAVTGTNGKTTVTTLVTAMLTESGERAVAAGNIGRPLVAAATDDVDTVVVEVSSFQLQFTDTFHPRVAVFLNAAPDHLDWHAGFDEYVAAKARIWRNQTGADVTIFNADDPVVAGAVRAAPARTIAFTVGPGPGGYRVDDGMLVDTVGTPLVAARALPRATPVDLANALAAAAAAAEAGASPAGIERALTRFTGLPHRVTLVGEDRGVRFYDDSKATNPHAALSALRGFDSVVLIAGGRNKGLDLGALAGEAGRIRAVVAIGEAAGEVEAAFNGVRPVERADTMRAAVTRAAAVAQRGDAVLLSPACASFDWYESYAERGDDFSHEVERLFREDARGDSR
jgi:UDP-N-acetylmuramoylalanine--D-glutamate ligase